MSQLSLGLNPTAPNASAVNARRQPSGDQPQVFSVSDVNKAVKGTLESGFPLLWIKGELSNFKPHTSGHWYFSLKDSRSQISAVMFKGFNQQIRFRPRDGMEVIVRGKITVYEPRGNYQVFCELMEPVGAGAMQMAFEQLKAKLQAEGLFEQARKRPLPTMPRHIAVVTSPTGAAIRDILHVLERRFKGLKITVAPAVVQGEQAPQSIVAALEMVNRLSDVDAVIVGRGGGSMEDLWCFNDEKVVRAIAAMKVPTISAVGHEIDFTIPDFVADVRAPTPSAAAEIVVKSAAELAERLKLHRNLLQQLMGHSLTLLKRKLLSTQQRLVDPKRRLADLILRCDELHGRLLQSIERILRDQRSHLELVQHRMGSPAERIERLRGRIAEARLRLAAQVRLEMERSSARLSQAAALLDNLSPLKVLDRGYAIATFKNKVLRSTENVKLNDSIQIRLAKGQLEAEVKAIKAEE